MKLSKKERIDCLARTHDYFPAVFRWRGRRFEVLTVEKCWTSKPSTAKRLFRVRCAEGSFVLEYTVATELWQVSEWPLTLWLPWSKSATPARFPLPRSQRRPQLQPASVRSNGGPKIAAATPNAPKTAKTIAPAAQSLAMRARS